MCVGAGNMFEKNSAGLRDRPVSGLLGGDRKVRNMICEIPAPEGTEDKACDSERPVFLYDNRPGPAVLVDDVFDNDKGFAVIDILSSFPRWFP